MNNELEMRNQQELIQSLSLAQHTVYKQYLSEISQYPLVRPSQELLDEKAADCLRFFHLKKFTNKSNEDIFQKLSTVYYASMSLGCSLAVVVDAAGIDEPVNFYLGVRNSNEDEDSRARLSISYRALTNGLKSNFSGSEVEDISAQKEMQTLVDDIFGSHVKHISAVSCVAAVRNKDKTEHKSFIQGLERFVDAMKGNTYTAIFLAEPVTAETQRTIRDGYEKLYSTLSTFRKSSWTFHENSSQAVMNSIAEGISQSIAEGTSETLSHGYNVGVSLGLNGGYSQGETHQQFESKPSGISKAGRVISIAGAAIPIISLAAGAVASVVATPIMGAAIKSCGDKVGQYVGNLGSSMMGNMSGTSIANTLTKSLGLSGGLNAGINKNQANTTSHSTTDTTSKTTTSGTTTTTGTGKTLQLDSINKSVEEMLSRIDEQLKRMQEAEDYGGYNCGAYFMSAKQDTVLLAANSYRALLMGEGSYIESSAINSWNGKENKETVDAIKEYLKRFVHPVFAIPFFNQKPSSLSEVGIYTPTTMVSGLELPLHLGLPTKSVYGLPVLEHAEFGQNVMKMTDWSDNRILPLGCIYHMGQVMKKGTVSLDLDSLTTHTFITGSTGAGKSNSIYHILSELNKQNIPFLIIEPAKGEYKKVLGGICSVYGTNPNFSDLLYLNPFAFPTEQIHVLEHIDRLIEIFNACWPMYAAMPAVLKDAVEQSYEKVGWNLQFSRCEPLVFPNFHDLLEILPQVMNRSLYSDDTKSDYAGALITRVSSLTNGIYGQIFCSGRSLSDEALFQGNVILDLSRIGSSETKALIMGLVVIKLQEYRMALDKMNYQLCHVTVLEEAHHLLRKTSTYQSQEGTNLQGKAVEMLTNSIAEMRTYGEGFIIADQAPELLDEAVIRNTNTKLVLRLPDELDRRIMGTAMALTEPQIKELAKLPCGVGAVYQNDWVEAVLCQCPKFENIRPLYYQGKKDEIAIFEKFFSVAFAIGERKFLSEQEIDYLKDWLHTLREGMDTIQIMSLVLDGESLSPSEQEQLAYNLFGGRDIAKLLLEKYNSKTCIHKVHRKIQSKFGFKDTFLVDYICKSLVKTVAKFVKQEQFEAKYSAYLEKRR